jgi:hypothetical protein
MWPAFVAATLLDGILLNKLPPIREGYDLIAGILIATFGNLFLIGAVAPWLARRIWKRRPAAEPGAPPRAQLEVLTDRIGTALLVASVLGLLAAGLAARPVVVAETEEKERAAEELYRYVAAHGTEELRRNVEASDMARLAPGYFRACVPHDDRDRWTCFFLDSRDEDDTSLVRDPSALPNRR